MKPPPGVELADVPRYDGPIDDVRGFNHKITRKGFAAIQLWYYADPKKDSAEWLAARRREQPSETHFRREYLLDWTSAPGDVFYPEFRQDPARYVHPIENLLPAPVARVWDFGYRNPACLWMQPGPNGRLWVIRELFYGGVREHQLTNVDTYVFRDLVLYCSGQLSMEDLRHRPRAVAWVSELEQHPEIPSPPWFGPGVRFIDLSGPEALKVSSTVEGQSKERTDAAVLALAGINLQMRSSALKAREDIIRRLLGTMKDGRPGLYIDPACRVLIQGLEGGITFAQPSKQNPEPDEAQKDGYYEHLHDCLGYGVVQLLRRTDPEEEQPALPTEVELNDGRIVMGQAGEQQVLWHETIDPDW